MKSTSLYRLVNGLRYFGVGAAFRRKIFKFPESYWVITRVNLSKDQNHGGIFGRLVWRGRATSTEEKKINSALKKQWELVSLPNYKHFHSKNGQVEEIIPKNTERTV